MGLSVFGDNPATLTSFSDPGVGGGDDFRMAEHVGAWVIVSVQGPKEVTTSQYGLKTAIACDVVVLDQKKEGQGEKFENVLIFNAAPVDQMKGLAGQTVAATIESYNTKQGGKAPKFGEPTPEVVKAAEAYLAAQG